jgi:WD40 repeat protein
VLALAYLPGGKAIASAGKDAVVRLWDADTGNEAGRWVGHLGWVTGLAFTHDGGTLVTGSYDRSVKAWDVSQSGGAQVLRGHKGWVQCLAMSSTGKDKQQILASGGKDGLVKLWDPTTGAPLGELAGHAGPVTAVAFAFAKSRMLAVGTWSDDGKGEIKLWELVREEKGTGYKGKELRTLKGHKGGVICLAFSPAGDRLASGSADKTAILWDAETGKAVHTLAGHQGEVRCMSFSSSGAELFTGCTDKLARVWDTVNGELMGQPFVAQTDSVEAIDFLLLPQGEPGILTAGPDQLIRLWTLGKDKKGFAAGGTVRAAGQPITCVARQRNTLFTGGWDGTVRIWSIELRPAEAEEPFRIDIRERFTFAGHTGPVRAVVLSLDQTVLATAGHDGTVRLWRATSRRAKAKEEVTK